MPPNDSVNVPHVKSEYAPAGKRLFRFLKSDTPYFQETIEHLICQDKVYLSSRKNFNDPFDMSPILKADWTTSAIREHMKTIAANPSLSAASPEVIAAFLKKGGKAQKEAFSTKNIRRFKEKFPAYMTDLLDKVGVCCFTEEMQNPLFWAHYAGTYTGVCAELSATADKTHPFCNCMKVNYSEHRPIVYGSQTGAFSTVYKKHNWTYIAQYGFCTKSIDWAVEREWRFWLPERAGTYQPLPPGTLRSIFIGPFAGPGTLDSIVNLARSTGNELKVFKTKLSEIDFRIEIEKRVL